MILQIVPAKIHNMINLSLFRIALRALKDMSNHSGSGK